jgi:ppGpp synthetase/RelA/SpoT-type nucleotidyltranferase
MRGDYRYHKRRRFRAAEPDIPSKTMKTVTADKLPNMHSTRFRGLPVVIEWPNGSTSVDKNDKGETFKIDMKADYGYIPDTTDVDHDDHLDVYIGPDEDAEYAYVIEQNRKSGEFDEYKIMLGFDSLEEAEKTYLEHMPEWALGDISEVPIDYLFDIVQKQREERKTAKAEQEDKEKEDKEKLSVIDAFVKLYKHEVDFYSEVARTAAEELEDALQESGIRAIVTHRAKKPRKLKGKLVERNEKEHYQSFKEIYDDVVDLAGVRVALYLPADRAVVGKIIERTFALVRKPKEFPRDRGPKDGMGYIATHYLVQLRPETLHKDELRYADTNVEIQVASVLMHAWAEVTHDLIYKPQKGSLNPKEMSLVDDLNEIVRAGESVLESLQESVESRSNSELRFKLSSEMGRVARRLAAQSKGTAAKRITASDVRRLAELALAEDVSKGIAEYLAALGWRSQGFNEWSHPSKLQEAVQLFPDGWIHRSWGKIVGTGDTLAELQAHLAENRLGESYKPPHVSYLKARIALWKAHGKPL